MSDTQPDPSFELQQLAQTILAVLEPLIHAAEAFASAAGAGAPGKCTQVWCPVCAMAAVASGEQHPLATMIADHGSSLLLLIRAMATPDDPEPTRDRADGVDHTPGAPGAYQPIEVTIHD